MAFIRGMSTKSALGLGGYSFDSLKVGAILQPKRRFSIRSNTYKLVAWEKNTHKMKKCEYLLVCGIEIIGDKKNIFVIKAKNLDTMKILKNEEATGENTAMSLWRITYGKTRMNNIGKNRFNLNLKILHA